MLNLLVPDETGQRALQETLADWRESRAGASGFTRVWRDVQGAASLGRVLAHLTLHDLCRWQILAPLGGLVVTAVLATAFLNGRQVFRYEGLSIGDRLLLFALLVPFAASLSAPFAAAMGLGFQSRPSARILGPLVLVLTAQLVTVGWLAPATSQAFRLRVWSSYAENRPADRLNVPPGPGVKELSLPRLVKAWVSDSSSWNRAWSQREISTRAGLVLAVPAFLLFGVAFRQRRVPRTTRLASAASGIAAVGVCVAGGLLSFVPVVSPGARMAEAVWLSVAIAIAATLLALRPPSNDRVSTERRA